MRRLRVPDGQWRCFSTDKPPRTLLSARVGQCVLGVVFGPDDEATRLAYIAEWLEARQGIWPRCFRGYTHMALPHRRKSPPPRGSYGE